MIDAPVGLQGRSISAKFIGYQDDVMIRVIREPGRIGRAGACEIA
jgi:hypothetical protein